MKKLKILLSFAILLALAFSFGIYQPINAMERNKASERAAKEIQSLKDNTKLLNYFYEIAPDEEYDGKYFPDYYGGSLIDEDGGLVIMLKDERGKSIVNSLITNVSFTKCKYSYAELVNTIHEINDKIQGLEDEKRKKYYSGTKLLDDKNTINVILRDISDEKIEWFQDNICNKPYLQFSNLTQEPEYHANYSGQGISTTSSNFPYSAAFRVKRTTNSGVHYGFITCAHYNNLFESVYGYNGAGIGNVVLRKFGGSIDASYVEMANSGNFSNNIYGTSYTLNDTNDDLLYPAINATVWIYARHHIGYPGVINTTNASYTDASTGISLSGLYGADYPSQFGDSGGLICDSPINYHCNPLGVNIGMYNGDSVFTGAIKIINYWYLLRY